MTTIVGTAHFVSKAAAVMYYGWQGETDLVATVERKLAAGEIFIGEPPLKAGESLTRIDDNTRYAIVEE